METSVISAQGLTKAFGSHLAVDELSFEVAAGRVTGFLGPNGAGKTTTMRMLLGLARPTSGTATVLGRPYTSLEQPSRTVGVVLDAASFHPRRSARNHLRWIAAGAGVRRARIAEVLETVDLGGVADRRVGEFSLGMRQRLGLAAALLGEPQLLIMDEPANGLDPAGMRWLREFLRAFAGSGGTVFVSSHLLAEVAQLADEVVVIQRGRLVTHTTVQALTAGPAGVVRVRTPDAERLTRVLLAAGAEVRTREEPGALHVLGMGAEQVGNLAAGQGVVLHELVGETQSLEDVFLELTGQEGEHARVG
jgi:ABC-2 type transport system ATP-binding protein